MSTRTRSVTRQMLNEEKMMQEETHRIEHNKLLESTYDADFQTMCDIETECYAQTKQLENQIRMLYKEIIDAYESHNQRRKNITTPYDESDYEASLKIMCDIEIECYAKIKPLDEDIKMIESKVINVFKEFDNKYQLYRKGL